MIRVYHPYDNTLTAGDRLPLPAGESHHLVRVRRARTGDEVEVFNGSGRIAKAAVEEAKGNETRLRVDSVDFHPRPEGGVSLLLAIPKSKVWTSLLRELPAHGVRRIFPVVTDHGETPLKRIRKDNKGRRREQALVEGMKQTGNPWLPVLEEPAGFDEALDRIGGLIPHRWVASLEPDSPPFPKELEGLSRDGRGEHILAIGPEGDFSPAEYRRLAEEGFQPVHLGPFVYRVEAAVSVAMGQLNWLLRLSR